MVYYLLIVNIISFFVYAVDKERAKKNEYRVSEKTLIFWAIIGGSLGAILSMYMFHHKTRKIKFILLVPLILFIWIFILCKIYI